MQLVFLYAFLEFFLLHNNQTFVQNEVFIVIIFAYYRKEVIKILWQTDKVFHSNN